MMRVGRNGIDGAVVRPIRTAGWTGAAGRIVDEMSRRTRETNCAAGAAALLGLVFVSVLLVLNGGCQKDAGVMPTNQAPVTYLSVLSDSAGRDLNTLSYRQILHWWGSDRDGRVDSFLIKWDSGWTPPDGAHRWVGDPSWVVTAATTDTFALATYGIADSSCSDPDQPCPPMYGRHTFFVRALDNDGLADPVGKTQEFRVGNTPPVLEWSRSFARPVNSLPAVAFAWHPTDRDGPGTIHSFVYWLTAAGKAAADSFFTADTLVALRPTAFGPAGSPQPGTWTLHVQAIDDSRTRSVPITHTWTVGLPAGQYLLIDNVGSNVPDFDDPSDDVDDRDDPFCRSMMDSVAAGNYHVMDIEAEGGFRTPVEVGPFLSLFKGVLWYSSMQNPANDAVVARNLSMADRGNGLRDYLSGGGRLVLCAQNAVGDSAALSRAFQIEVLGITDHYRRSDVTSLNPDYINGNIPLNINSVVRTMIGGRPDSLKMSSPMIDADFLILAPDITPIFTVAPGFLTENYPFSEGWRFTPDDQTTAPAVLGLLSERSGRIVVASLIPSRARKGFYSQRRVMAALLRDVFAN